MNYKQGVNRNNPKVDSPLKSKFSLGTFDFWFDPDYYAKKGYFGKDHPLYINKEPYKTRKEKCDGGT